MTLIIRFNEKKKSWTSSSSAAAGAGADDAWVFLCGFVLF